MGSMLIKNKELNNMKNKTDYTTKRNYFVSVDDDINNIQKKLHYKLFYEWYFGSKKWN